MICRLGRCWRVVYGLGMVELGLRVEQEMMMMKSLNHHCYYSIFWESSSVYDEITVFERGMNSERIRGSFNALRPLYKTIQKLLFGILGLLMC